VLPWYFTILCSFANDNKFFVKQGQFMLTFPDIDWLIKTVLFISLLHGMVSSQFAIKMKNVKRKETWSVKLKNRPRNIILKIKSHLANRASLSACCCLWQTVCLNLVYCKTVSCAWVIVPPFFDSIRFDHILTNRLSSTQEVNPIFSSA
jgi:hypothetical protein